MTEELAKQLARAFARQLREANVESEAADATEADEVARSEPPALWAVLLRRTLARRAGEACVVRAANIE